MSRPHAAHLLQAVLQAAFTPAARKPFAWFVSFVVIKAASVSRGRFAFAEIAFLDAEARAELPVRDRVRASASQAGLEVYSLKQVVVSGDYDRAVNAAEIKRRATTNVTDGSVILFHEWHNETLAQLPAILAELRRQGCVFETFSELGAHHRAKRATA